MIQAGPVYTLLEVPGKEELEPLTLDYYQNKNYKILRFFLYFLTAISTRMLEVIQVMWQNS